jgi:flavin reductase (DIM6/NTAB) family NADH-FMN oxidoreductase RutF
MKAPNAYRSYFYPMRLGVLCVAQNFMPIAWWTPVSKEPFRMLIAVDKTNHTLSLLREHGECALCFVRWEERVWLVRAGYLSGKKVPKSERLGVELRKAPALQSTFVPVQSLAVYEMRVRELPEDGDHALFIGDVVRVEGSAQAKARPILFLGYRDFATLGEQWRFRR